MLNKFKLDHKVREKPNERRRSSLGLDLLKDKEVEAHLNPNRQDLTKVIDKLVTAKHAKTENKLYKFMAKGENQQKSLIKNFFSSNENLMVTLLNKRKNTEAQAQEEYAQNKRTHNLEYNGELRNVLLKNYKRFQYPKVLTRPDIHLTKFNSYNHINQRDVNLGHILNNLKRNYIESNTKPKHFITLTKNKKTNDFGKKAENIKILTKSISILPNIKTPKRK
jgi:hypothetical protein